MSDFEDELERPKEWCTDLLSELAQTRGVGHTCDMRGTFRGHVNKKRREFLEEVLGLSDVDYRACQYCETFALAENAEEWPYYETCPDCIDELPDALQEHAKDDE